MNNADGRACKEFLEASSAANSTQPASDSGRDCSSLLEKEMRLREVQYPISGGMVRSLLLQEYAPAVQQ